MGTLPSELVGGFDAEDVVPSRSVARCAFCQTLNSGYQDGRWEDCGENLLLCKCCAEQVALALIEQGKPELVGERLRARLEKRAGIRARIAKAKKKSSGDCFNIKNDSEALEALAES